MYYKINHWCSLSFWFTGWYLLLLGTMALNNYTITLITSYREFQSNLQCGNYCRKLGTERIRANYGWLCVVLLFLPSVRPAAFEIENVKWMEKLFETIVWKKLSVIWQISIKTEQNDDAAFWQLQMNASKIMTMAGRIGDWLETIIYHWAVARRNNPVTVGSNPATKIFYEQRFYCPHLSSI